MAGEKGQRRREKKKGAAMQEKGRRGEGAHGEATSERERERDAARDAQSGQGGRDMLDAKVTSSVRWL